MNKDTVEGNWKQVKGTLTESWGKLTDDDLDVIEGNREQLAGRIQERYGKTHEEARREADEFWRRHPM
ncbi:MAG TPA: CsbD family protein [Steroidobacteraceae bacterium]|nr:CsbD family protein [Steroidobacteraceae bacterium]